MVELFFERLVIFILPACAALSTFILAVWYTVYEYNTAKLLKAHQTEWDRRKKVLKARGMREFDIDAAHEAYCDQLMKSRGCYGAALPKR